jgi:aminoglycoside phosphotransferase (APT) family kinase protein
MTTEETMDHAYARALDRERLARVLIDAGLGDGALDGLAPLGGGTYNTVYRLPRRDGGGLVIKVSPESTAPLLTHEYGLLGTEALFDRLAARAGVPVPPVFHVEHRHPLLDADVLILGECPGEPWQPATHDAAARRDVRHRLGMLVARLHTVTGTGYGYPGGSLGPLLPRWDIAFLRMMEAVLADAERFGVRLPRPVAEIRDIVTAYAGPLAALPAPVLVHFDLWDGNILVERRPNGARLTAIIDAERAFWGDPVADFVSVALAGDVESDPAFLDGYRAGGGTVVLDPPTRLRLALYRVYLHVIMLVEVVPRKLPADHRRFLRERIVPALITDLATLARQAPS